MSFIKEFEDCLRSSGYEPVKPIQATNPHGPWPRLRAAGDKKSKPSGTYCYIEEGDRAVGFYGSFKDDFEHKVWTSTQGREVSNDDMAEYKKWRRKKEAEIERAKLESERKVAAQVKLDYAMYDMPKKDHPYLVAKGIKAEGIRQDEDALVVPMRDMKTRNIWSLQRIYPNGGKYFEAGGRCKGLACILDAGECDKQTVVVCEGYSTGMTIREALGCVVVVAFNAGNLMSVIDEVPTAWPDAKVIVAGDNDQFTVIRGKPVNVGMVKAQAAAARIGAYSVLPEFKDEDLEKKPTDWNDYACLYGVEALKSELLRLNPVTKTEQGDRDVNLSDVNHSLPAPLPSKALEEDDGTLFDVVTQKNWISKMVSKDYKNPWPTGQLDTAFSEYNFLNMLRYDPRWSRTFMWDEFSRKVRIMRPLPWDNGEFKTREVSDTDLTNLSASLLTQDIKIKDENKMMKVLSAGARNNTTHPIRDYFDRLKWDGEKRLHTWLQDYAGATYQPDQYVSMVGKNVFIAAVKRIYNAGEKFDHMMVLEGSQAAGKSTLVQAMGTFEGEDYTSDRVSFNMINAPHVAQHLQGKIILEFSELNGLKGQGLEAVKSWITRCADEVLPKYQNVPIVWERQFVIVGTTNEDNWLTDPTGNRRFWPIRVGKVDLEGFKRIQKQLWAEAVHRAKAGEKHYVDDSDPLYAAAAMEQAKRMDRHVWHNRIEMYLEHRTEIDVEEILEKCLFIMPDRWTNYQQGDVRGILKTLGWKTKAMYCQEKGKTIRKWVPK